jgi:hypothetical protein
MPGWIPGALRIYRESAFSSNLTSVCEIRHTFLVQKQMTHYLVTGINDLTFEEGSHIVKFVSIMSKAFATSHNSEIFFIRCVAVCYVFCYSTLIKCMKQCSCWETDSRVLSKVMPRLLWA